MINRASVGIGGGETVREGDHFRFEHFGREVPAHAPALDMQQ